MKNKITLLLLFIVTTVSAQLEKFEGFWHSEYTNYNTLIRHDDRNDFLSINTFSFEDNTLTVESIKSVSDNEINTIAVSEDGWNLLIKYSIVNDSIMNAEITGSASITLTYKKIKY